MYSPAYRQYKPNRVYMEPPNKGHFILACRDDIYSADLFLVEFSSLGGSKCIIYYYY